MISVADYFDPKGLNHPEVTEQHQEDAALLLGKVNALLEEAEEDGGFIPQTDPDTGTCISGSPPRAEKSGDGGFRLSDSKTGAAKSAHKRARGVDVYDPGNRLDRYIDMFEEGEGYNTLLEKHGLYREAPGKTPGWCHLQDIAPGSGRRTFNP
jgi:hypothetical protein